MSQNSHSHHTGIILTFGALGIWDVKRNNTECVFGEKHIYTKCHGCTATNKGSCILVMGCWLQRERIIESHNLSRDARRQAQGSPEAPVRQPLTFCLEWQVKLWVCQCLGTPASPWGPFSSSQLLEAFWTEQDHKEWGLCWVGSWNHQNALVIREKLRLSDTVPWTSPVAPHSVHPHTSLVTKSR